MLRVVVSLTGVILVVGVTGGCGSEVCEEAYKKMTSCVSRLNCNGLDPLKLESCQATKKQWSQVDETAFVLGCKQNTAEAEKVVTCQLDPQCQCSK
jgi:hypothetical protein